MRKALISIAAALAAYGTAIADDNKMYLWLKDGNVLEYNIADVDSLTFEKVENGGDQGGQEQSTMLSAKEYMSAIETVTNINVPSAVKNNNNGGKAQTITYFSSKANKNKTATVLLPKNYDQNKKYPVLYLNHGIFGDHTSMQDEGNKINTMSTNLAASGEAKEMIIVFTSMYTCPTKDNCGGFTVEEMGYYDDFLIDIAESLMPYINKNYSTYTDRDHTAISGFSMGGREALYIGISRPDLFGYIGCACPAPGVTPGNDMYMSHPGNMQKSELKFKNGDPTPYVFMIFGGTNDNVVGTFPKEYHETLAANGVDHIWREIPGGGHDQSVIVPLFYNFLKAIFKEAKDF